MIQSKTGKWRVHHHNDLMDFTCKGYSEETKLVQKVCGQYINKASLTQSSIYEK